MNSEIAALRRELSDLREEVRVLRERVASLESFEFPNILSRSILRVADCCQQLH